MTDGRITTRLNGLIPGLLLLLFMAPQGGFAEENLASVPRVRTLRLQEGENWVSVSPHQESNRVVEVLGTDRLPSGMHLMQGTRVSWHDGEQGGNATNMVWLDQATGWRFLDGGEANDYRMPLDEGFVVFLPEGVGEVSLEVTEYVESGSAKQGTVHTLSPSGAYNMVRLELPAPLTLTNSGLREAGFTGAPPGDKVNPNNSDELRVLQGGGDSLAAPKARIVMDGDGHFVFWTGGPFLESAEAYELEDGTAVAVHTTRTVSNLLWRIPVTGGRSQ